MLTVFLSLGINAVRVSSLIPVESNYMPFISVYFFLSMLYTFLAFIWFILAEYFRSKKYLPYFLLKASLVCRSCCSIKKNKIQSSVQDSSDSINFDEIVRIVNISMLFCESSSTYFSLMKINFF